MSVNTHVNAVLAQEFSRDSADRSVTTTNNWNVHKTTKQQNNDSPSGTTSFYNTLTTKSIAICLSKHN